MYRILCQQLLLAYFRSTSILLSRKRRLQSFLFLLKPTQQDIPVKNMVGIGMKMGLFYVDFKEVKMEMGQDLLDDLWEEMMWFVTPERVKSAVREYFERMG